jgi:hypothetical protein
MGEGGRGGEVHGGTIDRFWFDRVPGSFGLDHGKELLAELGADPDIGSRGDLGERQTQLAGRS